MSNSQPSALFHLGYVSTETGAIGTQGMIELMTEARRINTERDITGLLLHSEKFFYQVLEGTETEVKRTVASIEKDERHTAVEVQIDSKIK